MPVDRIKTRGPAAPPPGAKEKSRDDARDATLKRVTKKVESKAAPNAAKGKRAAKSPVKRFRVLLEKDVRSEATGIVVPFDVRAAFGTRARVPVRGTINGFPYRSSIFPTGDGKHYMVVNKEVRAGACVAGGETVEILMERDDEPRTVEPPPDLLRALRASASARETWERLSYTHRKEHVRAVEEAKRPETRARRIERPIAQLAAGKKEFR